jgi:ankyrin repeat protein
VESEPDAETLEFARRVFDLARDGDAETLARYVDAGLPVDLTNDKGDTLLILAAYHEHAAAVDALLARGADPARVNDRGQSALVAAAMTTGADVLAGAPVVVPAEFLTVGDPARSTY